METNKNETIEIENVENVVNNEQPIEQTDILTSNWDKMVDEFYDMGLKKDLLRGIYGYGFEKPSFIQQKAIIPIKEGHDIIAQAQSGTGKTAAFAIGTLETVDLSLNEVQVLVLAPTRELAQQIGIVYKYLGEFLGAVVQVIIGGTNVKNDITNLKKGPQIVVGCPGRVKSMISNKNLKLADLKNFVLDEADEMLSQGFIEDIKEIIANIPPDCKINLFSATLPKGVVEITDNFMNNPVKILVKTDELTLEGIKQYYVMLKKDWKLDTLIDIYKGVEIAQAIIYCNSKTTVEFLNEEMTKRGHKVAAIHAKMTQIERDSVMKEFRAGVSRVLITTNLLARGIDIQQVSLVINYDIPDSKETYLHRIGRSGRFGRKGNAINFVTPDEKEQLEEIEKFFSTAIEKLPIDLSEV